LINDWPYGLTPGIRHIIVWLKNTLETEPIRGDLTPMSRQQVESFIQKTFVDKVKGLPGEQDRVIWFRNWRALQSVPGMDHVHVLIRDVPDNFVLEWTDGDKPMND
jgi:hypothetical protein